MRWLFQTLGYSKLHYTVVVDCWKKKSVFGGCQMVFWVSFSCRKKWCQHKIIFFFSQENSIFQAPQGPFQPNKSTDHSTQVYYLPCFNDTNWKWLECCRWLTFSPWLHLILCIWCAFLLLCARIIYNNMYCRSADYDRLCKEHVYTPVHFVHEFYPPFFSDILSCVGFDNQYGQTDHGNVFWFKWKYF